MQSVTNKKILIVDDDRANCDMGATALRKAGYEVFAAYSGDAALPVFKAQHPDVVIVDFAMPGMNGIEVATEIRKMEEPPHHTPILMLTAYARSILGDEQVLTSIDSFLTKPVMPADLVARVRGLLN